MRRNQSVTIAALIIAIVGLSIGFAAFSNTLTIRSSATVTPDDSNFQVKFSKVSNADQTGLSYPIEAILSHTGEAYANGSYNAVNFTGGNGEIDTNNPLLLKDLQANFTEPGQTVSYKLYIRNTGHYTAYLTNVNFKNIVGKEVAKECTGNDVTTALKNQACSDISVSLRIGSTDGVGGDLYTASNDNISTQTEPALNYTSLAVGASVEAYVTITYGGSTYIDGPMSVEFGDIMLQYRSVNTPTPIPEPVVSAKCTYVDNDTSGSITVGDKVSCPLEEQTDSFYVIEDLGQGSTVKMLAEWNLNVKEEGNEYSVLYPDGPIGYQDRHIVGYDGTEEFYGIIKYDDEGVDDYGYWTTGDNHDLNTSVYTACVGYPCYIYDNNSTIKAFVDTYVGYLNNALSTISTGRLIKYEELLSLGCDGNEGICTNAPSWVYQTSYWSGSANNKTEVFITVLDGGFGGTYSNTDGYGVRPVIEISSSVIEPAS